MIDSREAHSSLYYREKAPSAVPLYFHLVGELLKSHIMGPHTPYSRPVIVRGSGTYNIIIRGRLSHAVQKVPETEHRPPSSVWQAPLMGGWSAAEEALETTKNVPYHPVENGLFPVKGCTGSSRLQLCIQRALCLGLCWDFPAAEMIPGPAVTH